MKGTYSHKKAFGIFDFDLGSIQNLQSFPIPQTRNWKSTRTDDILTGLYIPNFLQNYKIYN